MSAAHSFSKFAPCWRVCSTNQGQPKPCSVVSLTKLIGLLTPCSWLVLFIFTRNHLKVIHIPVEYRTFKVIPPEIKLSIDFCSNFVH